MQLAYVSQITKWVCSDPSTGSGRGVFAGGAVGDTHKLDSAYPVGAGKLVGGALRVDPLGLFRHFCRATWRRHPQAPRCCACGWHPGRRAQWVCSDVFLLR